MPSRRSPTPKLAMGLYDYPQYIKYPMDLSTIHRKLREQRYRTVEEVLDDFQMIWDNCKVYNPPNSVSLTSLSGSIISLKDSKKHLKKWSSPTCRASPQLVIVLKLSPDRQRRERRVRAQQGRGIVAGRWSFFSSEASARRQTKADFSPKYEGCCRSH